MKQSKGKMPRGLTWDPKRKVYRIQFMSKGTRPGKYYGERLRPGMGKRAAESYLIKLREDDRMGQLLWPSEQKEQKAEMPTCRQFAIETYLPYCKAILRPDTVKFKSRKLNMLDPWFGDVPLDQVTPQLYLKFQTERKAEGVRNRTINMEAETLRAMLNHAKRVAVIDSVMEFEMLSTRDSKPSRALSVEEATRALAYAQEKSHLWYTLTLFLLHTGARWGDVRGLRWQDVDLDKRMVHFTKESSKHGKARQVPLVPDVVEALRLLEPIDELVFARVSKNTGQIIYLTRGNNLGNRYPWEGPDKDCRFGPHTFRHTFASWKLEAGVSIALVSKWLGHSSISMTVDKYGHIEPQSTQDEMMRGPLISIPKLKVV